jgi:hypothetical protein
MRTMVEAPRRSRVSTGHDLTRCAEPGAALSLLVLASSPLCLVAVDLASGSVLRAPGGSLDGRLARPLDVLRAHLADDQTHDPDHPDAVVLCDAEPAGRLNHWRAERWLRHVVHPVGHHLLGYAGSAVPFWRLDGSRPSVALVPAAAALGVDDEGVLRARFSWLGLPHDLPASLGRGCTSPTAATRLVVALSPPVEGACWKVVDGLL